MNKIKLDRFVISLYQQLLNREPDEVGVTHYLKLIENGSLTLETAISIFVNSEEYQSKHPRLEGYYHNNIEWKTDEKTCELIFGEIFSYWNSVGIDLETVYWSVLTNPKYRGKISDRAIQEFYSSSPTVGNQYLEIWQSFQGEKQPTSIVDFGAGVGRISMGLNLTFVDSKIAAVDFSQGHLKTLTSNLKNSKLTFSNKLKPENIQCVSYSSLSELRMRLSSLNPSFIVSTIVLQHNPPPLMAFVVKTLLDSLANNGLAVLHIPTFSLEYSFILQDYLSKPTESKINMQMHALPVNAIFEIAKNSNCQVVQFLPSNNCVAAFLSYDVIFIKE